MTPVALNNYAVPKRILAMVLAGGEGTRLRPLTDTHSKPAVQIGSGLRLVDFVLSNLVNSGIDTIYLLAQYKPESLIEHIDANWNLARYGHDRFVRVVLPQNEHGGYFRGTADAVFQNLALIKQHKPDIVAIFAADHIYRMDVRQMVQYHHESGADVTIAATQVPLAQASSFGIISADFRGEVWNFQEKPDAPFAMPSNPDYAYASMGNYLFNTAVLEEELEWAVRCGETDFGGHILPNLIRTHQVHAYDFARNIIPGVHPHEEGTYWRDVGTLDAYVNAHRDLVGPTPRFNLQNPHWPILTSALTQQPALVASHGLHEREMRDNLPFPVRDALTGKFEVLQIGNA